MKKIISVILVLILMLSSVSAFAESHITLTLNGKFLQTDVSPQIVNNRTMVPVRVIFEALGMKVGWNAENQMVYTEDAPVNLFMTIGSTKMLVGDVIKIIDAPPFVSNGRTFVSARAVCEALGCTVEWDGVNRNVIIKTAGYAEPPVYSGIIGNNPAYAEKEPEHENDLLVLINSQRTALGLGALTYDDDLEQIAYSHSEDMAVRDYFDHDSPEGITPFDRLENAGIFYTAAAENVAAGFVNANEVFKAWMNSDGHRANMLNENVTKIGVGYYKGGSNGTYWTLVLTD